MSRFIVLKEFKPERVIRGIRNRGVKGAAFHGLRRAGTIAETALVGPHSIRINPMDYVCNHTCPMCWLQHLDPEDLKRGKKSDLQDGMKLADYKKMFDGMPPGVGEINIVGGGEPLVHPDCPEIMREIKRHGWRGWIITNGTLMKESVSQTMVEIGWDMVRVSVHAGDAETYKQVQGVDRFEQLRANLKAYDRLRREAGSNDKMQLVMLHVLQKENIHTIEKLFAFAEEAGSDSIVFEKIIPYSSGRTMDAEDFKGAREALIACARDSRVPCNLEQILPELQVEEACAREHKPFVPAKRCSVGFDHVFITGHGDVKPCCFSDEVMGNVREKSFSEIWFSPEYAEFRKRLINGRFAPYCIVNRCTQKGVLHN